MTKRAAIYTRVSTDEQAEHGYSLQSQLEACRTYADRQGYTVAAELQDDYSGAKLGRPGLDQLRATIDRREIEAVIVYTSDRLTRNLAHSLILREEWQRAGIELHYCNRGKSENTPESRMTENIEAVFGDYWRAKIIEASGRGRRTKAANGKWPCDGHPAYGYRREGKAREAHLVIDESEAAVVRRIFALYIGDYGNPLSLQTIAALLTAEKIPPPNRGGAAGKGHKGKGWYKGTIINIVSRRAYIGEFQYGGQVINMPELAFIDLETFAAAQKRRAQSRALSLREHKYDFLLTGHIRCDCQLSMSGKPMLHGKYLYYACNSLLNKRHMRGCQEKMVRADAADAIIWEWVTSLMCDESKLDKGLRHMTEHYESETQTKRERLALIEQLIAETADKIKRLASAFAEEKDEMIAAALRGEMKQAGREREALSAERDTLLAELVQGQITEADIEAIKALAAEIRAKLAEATFEKKRALMKVLDVRVKLESENGQRGLKVTCRLTLEDKPSQNQTPSETKSLSGMWLSLPAIWETSSSTMMT